MTLLFYIVGAGASIFIGLWLVERLIALTIRWTGAWLPHDVVGPEGWLIDTKSKAGVFDRGVRS